MAWDTEKMNILLATDCGSTTSKARFFKKIAGEYRFVASGEAPTTVEAPFEDVTVGVRNAIRQVEELTGHRLLTPEGVIMPSNGENDGVDMYVTTSSAGGGLQMIVAGHIRTMTGESAERAALGAGAVVMDVVADDDGRELYQRVERIRFLRPDMILLSGGTDGGASDQVTSMIEFVATADPKPRLGTGYKLPIIYAGNKNLRSFVNKILGEHFSIKIVDNLRPTLDVENTEPARNAVHELFMEHVMSHAPGYDRLMKWTPIPIMPTPAGEGMGFRTIAEMSNINVIGVGLGGATTNIYSIYDGRFVRSVSANLGMSYSICNVLKEAGIKNITRWMPFDLSETELRDRLSNKMIRPTTIPETFNELMVEHAIAREALRLGFQHHKTLARPLQGVGVSDDQKGVSRLFEEQADFSTTYIDMLKIGLIGGTGGLLSHAPRRIQSAIILIDGFRPEGVTRLVQDSVFMMPHLGVLSTVHPKAAIEIFDKDCLVRIGTCIAFRGTLEGQEKEIAELSIRMPNGETVEDKPVYGTIKRIPLKADESAEIEIKPIKEFDIGSGPGNIMRTKINGGVCGIIIDARGRPLSLPESDDKRRQKLVEWFTALNAYPEELLKNT